MSLVRFLTAGALAALVPMVSGAQQGTEGSFTRREMLINAPAPLADAMKTSIGADSVHRLPVPDGVDIPQKSVTTIFDDGFEGGIPASWNVFGDGDVFWDDTDYRSHLGSRSVWCAGGGANRQPAGGDYANNMNAWMIFGPFSLSDAVAGSMRFWLWNDSELYHDTVMWGVSTDGESFGVVQLTGTTSGWAEETVDFTDVSALGDVTGQSNVWVAFAFRSNGSTNGPGAYIDDVRIEKSAAGEEPDLLVQSASVSDSTPMVGESFTINATVKNQGASTSDSTTLRYYLSGDSVISGSDTEIGTDTVPALALNGTSSQTLITSIDTSGASWVGACVDSVSGESNVSNNCSSGVQMDVGGGGGGGGRAFDYFVAAIAHTRGVGDSVWRTKLGVLNFSGGTAEVELTYLHDGEASTETLTLAHAELRTWDDAAVGLFGVSGRSSGPVFIASDQQLVITSRTYSEGEQGTFGSFMEAAGLSQTFVFGDVGVVSQLCGNNDFRTNIGVVNLTDSSCRVRVWVRSASGLEIGSPVNVTLDAYGFEQINDVFAASGSGFRDNAYAVVNVLTQGCEVWGYGSVIDGVAAYPGTNDATIIPMRKVWVGPGPLLIVGVSADFSTTHSIWGMGWIPDSQVTLTIDRGADGSIDLERTTVIGEDGDARFRESEYDPALQVAEGDIVELSDGVIRVTYVVCYVTLDSIDRGTNILSGRAREGTVVWVGVDDPSPHVPHSREFQVMVGSSEAWTVDFTGVFDIVSDTTGYVISGCGQSHASTMITF
jgi:hypothetical protein